MNLFIVAAFGAACSHPSDRAMELRAALDETKISLGDSVAISEQDGASARTASLLTGADPVYAIDRESQAQFENVKVDGRSGTILSAVAMAAPSSEDCAGAISLADAIDAALAEVSGDAVSAGPDDDGRCNTEVIVLSGDVEWEVKIGPSGDLVESPEKADGESEK